MWTDSIAPIRNENAAADRARDLEAANLNGLAAAIISLDPPVAPGTAEIALYFVNALHVADILAEITGGTPASEVFPIRGGHRVPAGPGAGQVQVTDVAAGPDPESLTLTIEPIGDYSTYTLELLFDPARIDPFFAEIGFKFRPGCFTHACSPNWEAGRPRVVAPKINYLAKDYDSFRHQLIAGMMDRVPGWQPSSEADFDQVLISLFSAAGDELSDYQDRVMAEAYLGSARKRVSVARHARLMDYYVDEGQQASTDIWIEVAEGTARFTLDDDLIAWAGEADSETGQIPFATRQAELAVDERVTLSPEFNAFHLHTWSGAHPALPAGATSAEIIPAPTPTAPAGLITAADLALAIEDGTLSQIMIAEVLNPLTGRDVGRDPIKRQMLRLIPEATVIPDPVAGRDIVRIKWQDADALTRDYSFTTLCPGGPVDNISLFRGNLVEVHQGLPVEAHLYEPGTELPVETPGVYHRHFLRRTLYGETRGVLCALPGGPLAYRPTPTGGEVPAQSTLVVGVEGTGGAIDTFDERPSLVFSDDSTEEGDHFVVETDERQRSLMRFGNGVNGRLVPVGGIVHARYQIGGGLIGNVGADAIRHFRPLPVPHANAIVAISNPFDVTNGTAPEPVAQVLRNAPEAYRARQLRAVTPADYIARAEEVPGIARAVASYTYTGSWRAVRLVLDPEGTTDLDGTLLDDVATHLEAVRLIGEDLELRAPRFVPLSIEVSVCLTPDAWPEDLRDIIEQELSDGYTPDGRRGLFHPDEWTFGQSLHESQIAGRLHAIPGIAHILSIKMRRWDAPTGGVVGQTELTTAFDEIFLVENNPDHLERGTIMLDLKGGRQ